MIEFVAGLAGHRGLRQHEGAVDVVLQEARGGSRGRPLVRPGGAAQERDGDRKADEVVFDSGAWFRHIVPQLFGLQKGASCASIW